MQGQLLNFRKWSTNLRLKFCEMAVICFEKGSVKSCKIDQFTNLIIKITAEVQGILQHKLYLQYRDWPKWVRNQRFSIADVQITGTAYI